MSDIVSPIKRSSMMRAVRQKDTRPEIFVRSILRNLGISYRVRNRDLPGSPDIANRSRRWAIFVQGCYWHGHKNCPQTKSGSSPGLPVQNREFWRKKFEANRQRDARKARLLRKSGFRVILVWECQLRDTDRVTKRLVRLEPGKDSCRSGRRK